MGCGVTEGVSGEAIGERKGVRGKGFGRVVGREAIDRGTGGGAGEGIGAAGASGPPASRHSCSVSRYLSELSLRLWPSTGMATRSSSSSASTSRSTNSAIGYTPPTRPYTEWPPGRSGPGSGRGRSPGKTTHSSIIEIMSALRSSTSSEGRPNSPHTSLKMPMKASHSASEMLRCLCA